ncbi:hypothetical protein ABB37_07824 [Leptomonas pyrrhocoris]|uniref:Transmembrane protein n=1 Tax=Leptomonas pyrrhocoris TaxID=157538 RepID=A0A0M9FUT8_LEPPY|nr:hypothetical protein ABB37_07824 [Leptomonas pyrrhocoris]KPA76530.1 hypothetical protein ABB37_07824 [Leptomonas pyrrhocoris]|eukprot:XP_015654969.1 hypothetical protein ABB37_07824 [Leptomonas pyrrhocoris]
MEFREQSIDKTLQNRLVSESGMSSDSILVFEIAPVAAAASRLSGSLEDARACSAMLDPLKGGMGGLVSRSARFTILRATGANGATCSLPLNVSLVSGNRMSMTTLLFDDAKSMFSKSVTFDAAKDGSWPMEVTFSSQCTLQFVLLVDRYGTINRWYVWIPTTVYTAIIVALFLPTVALRRPLPVHLAGLYLFLVFFGFLGSTIGLVVELLQWQSTLGRMFPFPPSVTLYSCLPILYMLLFFPTLYRQGNNTILFMGTTRLFTYGLNCALCVGYWIAGYVVLGSLAVFQLLATNFIITWYYAYVTVRLRRAVQGSSSLPKFSNNFIYLWCAPVTPFACCALMYYDLYLLTHRDAKRDVCAIRMRDVARVYNVQMSLPLLFFQNIYGVALLATATAFHMPFVVLLFVALLFWVVHSIYVIEQYCKELSRWRRHGTSFSTCVCLSLSAVMNKLLSGSVGEASSPSPPSQAFSHAVIPSPERMRRRSQAGQYEEDLAEYRNSQLSSSATSDDDDSYDDRLQRRSRRPIPDQSAAFSTPSQQTINDAPEFWPSSVER